MSMYMFMKYEAGVLHTYIRGSRPNCEDLRVVSSYRLKR